MSEVVSKRETLSCGRMSVFASSGEASLVKPLAKRPNNSRRLVWRSAAQKPNYRHRRLLRARRERPSRRRTAEQSDKIPSPHRSSLRRIASHPTRVDKLHLVHHSNSAAHVSDGSRRDYRASPRVSPLHLNEQIYAAIARGPLVPASDVATFTLSHYRRWKAAPLKCQG
jgi:hypothetical protein